MSTLTPPIWWQPAMSYIRENLSMKPEAWDVFRGYTADAVRLDILPRDVSNNRAILNILEMWKAILNVKAHDGDVNWLINEVMHVVERGDK